MRLRRRRYDLDRPCIVLHTSATVAPEQDLWCVSLLVCTRIRQEFANHFLHTAPIRSRLWLKDLAAVKRDHSRLFLMLGVLLLQIVVILLDRNLSRFGFIANAASFLPAQRGKFSIISSCRRFLCVQMSYHTWWRYHLVGGAWLHRHCYWIRRELLLRGWASIQ